MRLLKKIFSLTITITTIIASTTTALAESKTDAVQTDTEVIAKSETSDELQLENIKNLKKISFQDAWVAWENNKKFPVAFFGDSTFDGNQTSGWIKNEIGQDHQPPNAFTTYLQNLIRKYTGSTVARIYNAGFSGQTAEWGYSNIDNIFSGAYSDVKMIGIGFGINDRLNKTSTEDYKEQFKENIENIIVWCFKNNIQPFLLTTQATVEPGSIDSSTYPYRTSENINSIANTVKKELAKKYNIELIDMNYYTSKLMASNGTYNLKDIISTDHLHFTDLGHKFESEVLFSYFNPRVIILDGKKQMKLDFTSQNMKSNISSDRVSFENDHINLWYTNYLFNNFIYYDKEDKSDVLLQDFIVLNLSNNLNLYSVQIQAAQNLGYSLPSSDIEKPYVVFNDISYILNDTIQLFSYTRNIPSLDNIINLNELLCSDIGSSSKNLMSSSGLYVEITSTSIKVYSNLKLSPILSYDTNGKVIGAGIFANFIKLLNQDNDQYAIVTADVLYNP